MDFKSLTIKALTELAAQKRQFAAEAVEADSPTIEDIEAAEAALTEAQGAEAEISARAEAEAELATRTAALKAGLEQPTEAAAEVVEEEDDKEEVEAAVEAEAAAVETEAAPVAASVATIASRTERPKSPARAKGRVSITAAADVPDFGSGEDLGSIARVAEALVSKARSFGTPNGTLDQSDPNYKADFRFSGVAKFGLEFPEELRIERGSDDMAVIDRATDEKRLEGKSLVAAGGWCTPSENLYDLCEGETLDGLISVPEVQVSRGGINFTKGPQFSDIYAGTGFIQTEAQAEAGVEKPCYELTCPDWTEVRLDAVGLCIRVPILTNAAFPELTERVVRGSMVAHQHKVNASVISRMVALAGAATAAVDYTGTAMSLWANLSRIAYLTRQRYKLGLSESLEVILPAWVREAIRDDLAIRGNRPLEEVTDAYIMREFAVRNLAVQFVYDWQELGASAKAGGYPPTVNVLMYPAGTYVKGVSDVISLNAVYDAASLKVNTYTGLFFEEGLLVANKCYDASLVTIPVCGSGKTGGNTVDQCGIDGSIS